MVEFIGIYTVFLDAVIIEMVALNYLNLKCRDNCGVFLHFCETIIYELWHTRTRIFIIILLFILRLRLSQFKIETCYLFENCTILNTNKLTVNSTIVRCFLKLITIKNISDAITYWFFWSEFFQSPSEPIHWNVE